LRPIDRFLPFPHLSWIMILRANPQFEGAPSVELSKMVSFHNSSLGPSTSKAS